MSYIGQAPTTTAFVTDQFSGTGSQTAFTMSLAPATTSSILVSVTGVLQDPSTYSVSGTTLTFSAAPPSGTGNISVRYLGIPASGVTTTAYRTVTEFTATAGQTSFSVPSYTVGYINVYRNGARLGAADFTATTGTTVVLANACNAGDLVVTESFYVSSVLNAIPATAGAVNSTYIANGAVGSTQIAAGGVAQSNLAAGVAGNGPAFSAYNSTGQSVSATTTTKVTFDSKLFDTASCFSTSTSRFTPNVAGYYQLSTGILFAGVSGVCLTTMYKNGSPVAELARTYSGGSSATNGGSVIVYANGTTDYFEVYIYSEINQNIGNTNPYTKWFCGALVRAA